MGKQANPASTTRLMNRFWNWITTLGFGRDKTEQEAVQRRLEEPPVRLVYTVDVSRLSSGEQRRVILDWRKKLRSQTWQPFGSGHVPCSVPLLVSGVNKV